MVRLLKKAIELGPDLEVESTVELLKETKVKFGAGVDSRFVCS